ncbi:MAG: VWA domain-containing protein [Lachnospiraceae bacterium]|nr:VWA domain-containing protein [Lachnospiraceae bacterium]
MKKRVCALIMTGMMLFSACGKNETEATGAMPAAEYPMSAGAAAEGFSAGHSAVMMDAAVETSAGTAAEAMYTGSATGAVTTNQQQVKSGVLTAAVWNDLENWDFFTGLVQNQTISFPAYGIDPVRRVAVTVRDGNQNPVENEPVVLKDVQGAELWSTVTDAEGKAYLFYMDGEEAAKVSVCGESLDVSDEMEFVTEDAGNAGTGLQVMFILDTTGSMGDELNYLKKDFQAIVADVDGDNILYSANFYRDQGDDYVTKCNPFTDDTTLVQQQFDAESADGGGDAPEAVAEILEETMIQGAWKNGYRKIAFLIFDAPPHDGMEETLDKAVRAAAAKGIHVIPVVASNADRSTELFGRALAICTNGEYVFLTDDSGVGDSHLEPIVGQYTVEALHDIIVRLIKEYQP